MLVKYQRVIGPNKMLFNPFKNIFRFLTAGRITRQNGQLYIENPFISNVTRSGLIVTTMSEFKELGTDTRLTTSFNAF